ncbi:MAG: penicillin-binding protein 1C [Bacteroidia bacterium]|nr:penicillin-binding protein 1C [Bacteroidia bacterium]
MIGLLKSLNRRSRLFFRLGFKIFVLWYAYCLPAKLFNDPTSTVLLDKDDNLLCAKIADDGQWRFPASKKVPEKFKICLLQFEDRNFEEHLGVSLKGIGRAMKQNVSHGKIISGGSTITMQLSRIMRKNPPRKFGEKIVEMVLATRIEISYSKTEILSMYASNAPFGSNVVGLDAASWRYFGRPADKLSWAESATLAVLPNAPGLIHPGKNRKRLLEKRNRLLTRLHEIDILDNDSYQLALEEPLPEKPLALSQAAPHLLDRAIAEGHKGQIIKTTLSLNFQKQITTILAQHHEHLRENQVFNGAILVLSVKTGKVLAYVGNTKSDDPENGCAVDIIPSSRSTGSTLKPLLYAKMIDEGKLMPKQLIPDIPTQIGGYTPKNFSPNYDGAVPANRALSRSLNIPAVRLLNEYGVEKFRKDLNRVGFTTMKKHADYYGLSLILGGAEANMWDMCNVYAGMGRILNNDQRNNGDIFSKSTYINEINYKKIQTKTVNHKLSNTKTNNETTNEQNNQPTLNYKPKTNNEQLTTDNYSSNEIISRGAVWHTFEAMVEVNRPDEEGNWRAFDAAQKIAWKTGTSFGFRDAWAVGVTPDYVVGVWVGNADGEGRPGLTGIKSAAPVLFDVFSALPKSNWFKMPENDMEKMVVCRMSGHRATENCTTVDTVMLAKSCLNTTGCPYHQIVHLDKKMKFRVTGDCEDMVNMRHEKWFVLPAVIEKFYKYNNPEYKVLPDYRCDCQQNENKDKSLAIIYPKKNSKIYLPLTFDGSTGKTVFEATHRISSSRLFWHLDDVFIGETKDIHQMEMNPPVGKHKLYITDEKGRAAGVNFEVLGKDEDVAGN